MNSTKTVTIDNTNSGNRLDIFVSEAFPNISRSSIQNQIKKGLITVNNEAVKPSYILKNGDTILCDFDFPATNQINVLSNYDIPLDIIYEDSDIIVLNKPAGISVHTSENEKEKTLVNALVNYYPEIAKVNTPSSIEKNIARPGIVHRLDKDTSGVMVVAKNLMAFEYLKQIIKTRQISKKYLALCYGWPDKKSGKLINYLGRKNNDRKVFTEVGVINGKMAISHYKVIQSFITDKKEHFSLIQFDILTGRTHQIRCQSLLHGFPILGDKYYFTKESKQLSVRLGAKRQALHSWKLSFKLLNGEGKNEYEAPLSEDIASITSKHSNNNF